MTKILVLFHSVTGHIECMAHAEAEGARNVAGAKSWSSARESNYEEAVQKLGNDDKRDASEATPEELADYDAIIFGTPTRFGNLSGQMRGRADRQGGQRHHLERRSMVARKARS